MSIGDKSIRDQDNVIASRRANDSALGQYRTPSQRSNLIHELDCHIAALLAITKKWLKNYLPYFLIAFASLIVTISIIGKGYIILLDLAFAPKFKIFYEPETTSNIPFNYMILTITTVIPAFIFQYIYFFLILFLSGFSMYKLIPLQEKYLKLTASFFYMFNPFVYFRLIAGHWQLLLAYSLIPLAIHSFFKLSKKASFKNTLFSAIWLSVLPMISVHSIFLAFIFFLILIINVKHLKPVRIFKILSICMIFFIALNFYWIYPIQKTKYLKKFDNRMMNAFKPTSDQYYGAVFNVASLYGLWSANDLTVKNYIPAWRLMFILIFLLSSLGFLYSYKNKIFKKTAIVFICIFIVSLALGPGLSSLVTHKIFSLLYNSIQPLRGYRDSQKFAGYLALVYSFFLPFSFLYFKNNIKNNFKKIFLLVFSIFILIYYNHPFFWMLRKEIKPVNYPSSWYRANRILNKDVSNLKVLFLPWHQYMEFDFVKPGGVSINPARAFFDKPVIQGDNIEIGGIYSVSDNPVSKEIEANLSNKNYEDFSMMLSKQKIKYILLSVDDDSEYQFLYRLNNLKVILKENDLILFKTQKTGKI